MASGGSIELKHAAHILPTVSIVHNLTILHDSVGAVVIADQLDDGPGEEEVEHAVVFVGESCVSWLF